MRRVTSLAAVKRAADDLRPRLVGAIAQLAPSAAVLPPAVGLVVAEFIAKRSSYHSGCDGRVRYPAAAAPPLAAPQRPRCWPLRGRHVAGRGPGRRGAVRAP